MKKGCGLLAVILCLIFLSSTAFAQPLPKSKGSAGFSIKPGIGLESFSRTIALDENKSSKLKFLGATIDAELELSELLQGFSLNVLFGYSSSNFNSLAFKKLPFSIDFDGGRINGYLLGGGAKYSFGSVGNFEIEAAVQFVTYMGVEKEWQIPGLAVAGKLKSKPSWSRVTAGPIVIFKGIEGLYPYLSPQFNKLWGTFEMNENIQTLAGKEDKKIKGKGSLGIAAGVIYEMSSHFLLKGEANLYPYQGGLDAGFGIKTQFSF